MSMVGPMLPMPPLRLVPSICLGTSTACLQDISFVDKCTHSFNEPDNGGQSNIDPTTAAALWKANIQPFAGKAKLVGPAVTNGGGVQWLQQFLGNCTGCTIDAIAMHWYDTATVSCLLL